MIFDFCLVLLTNLLLDDLKRSSPSRVVIISSKLHDSNARLGNPPKFKWDLDEINNEMDYDGMVAYKNSKLANIWFAYELARRLESTGVDVHVVCPVQIIMLCFSYFGSECEVFAATSNTLNGKTGVFISDMKEARSSEESYNVEKAKRLWDLSEQLTHQNI
ncbi:unnamed protein product [Rotaria sp. Silwood2]|nr:unnamed protein product [Rotaria sp. Silwood2]